MRVAQHAAPLLRIKLDQLARRGLSGQRGRAIFDLARSGGTGRRSRLKICRSFALCGFDSLLRDHFPHLMTGCGLPAGSVDDHCLAGLLIENDVPALRRLRDFFDAKFRRF